MATNKYSVKGVADMKQHDTAIKKSASEVYKYKKQVEGAKADIKKFAGGVGDLVGKFGKFIPAIAAVSSATAIFNKTMQATQTTGDAFDIVIAQSTASVNYFFTSLSRGNFDGFLDGLKNIIKEAKDAQVALDNLNTSKLFSSNVGARYNAERSELERIIRDPKSTPEQIKVAQSKLATLPAEYAEELRKQKNLADEAFRKVSAEIFANHGLKAVDVRVYEMFIEGNEELLKQHPKLNDITDEEIQKMSELYQRVQNLKTQINELYSDNSRLLNKSTKVTPTKPTTKAINPADLEKWETNNPISDPTPIITNFGSGSIYGNRLNVDSWIGDIEYKEWKLEQATKAANEELEKQKNIFDLQLDSISSLASAFSTLGNEYDSTELKAAGIIAEAIANIIKGYATASAESATTGPWAWAAFSAAGLAQLVAVISQIHSLSGYASGGIIQGSNTIGDYNLARVNSGEMILNGTQQARLFRMLNNGSSVSGSVSGSVEFKIKGQELVGVLNNYNKKTGRVL